MLMTPYGPTHSTSSTTCNPWSKSAAVSDTNKNGWFVRITCIHFAKVNPNKKSHACAAIFPWWYLESVSSYQSIAQNIFSTVNCSPLSNFTPHFSQCDIILCDILFDIAQKVLMYLKSIDQILDWANNGGSYLSPSVFVSKQHFNIYAHQKPKLIIF